jgi:hypothetical protein
VTAPRLQKSAPPRRWRAPGPGPPRGGTMEGGGERKREGSPPLFWAVLARGGLGKSRKSQPGGRWAWPTPLNRATSPGRAAATGPPRVGRTTGQWPTGAGLDSAQTRCGTALSQLGTLEASNSGCLDPALAPRCIRLTHPQPDPGHQPELPVPPTSTS